MSDPVFPPAPELHKDFDAARARGGQHWKAARARAAAFDWDRAIELNRQTRRELYGSQ